MSGCCTQNGVPIVSGQIEYSPPYWDDLRVPVSATSVGGANDPQFVKVIDNGAGSQGIYAQLFSAAVEQELFFWCQVPHSWRVGTPLNPHVHWFPENNGAGSVVWGLEYTISTIGGTFGASQIISGTGSTTSTAFVHRTTAITPIVMGSNLISTMLGCRVFRWVSDPSDNYGSRAALLEIDFHFQQDTPGSRSEFNK